MATEPVCRPATEAIAWYETVLGARLVDRGATVREEPTTFVTGDRFASVVDPFGHRWAIVTRVEDVPPEEAKRRLDQWAAQQG